MARTRERLADRKGKPSVNKRSDGHLVSANIEEPVRQPTRGLSIITGKEHGGAVSKVGHKSPKSIMSATERPRVGGKAPRQFPVRRYISSSPSPSESSINAGHSPTLSPLYGDDIALPLLSNPPPTGSLNNFMAGDDSSSNIESSSVVDAQADPDGYPSIESRDGEAPSTGPQSSSSVNEVTIEDHPSLLGLNVKDMLSHAAILLLPLIKNLMTPSKRKHVRKTATEKESGRWDFLLIPALRKYGFGLEITTLVMSLVLPLLPLDGIKEISRRLNTVRECLLQCCCSEVERFSFATALLHWHLEKRASKPELKNLVKPLCEWLIHRPLPPIAKNRQGPVKWAAILSRSELWKWRDELTRSSTYFGQNFFEPRPKVMYNYVEVFLPIEPLLSSLNHVLECVYGANNDPLDDNTVMNIEGIVSESSRVNMISTDIQDGFEDPLVSEPLPVDKLLPASVFIRQMASQIRDRLLDPYTVANASQGSYSLISLCPIFQKGDVGLSSFCISLYDVKASQMNSDETLIDIENAISDDQLVYYRCAYTTGNYTEPAILGVPTLFDLNLPTYLRCAAVIDRTAYYCGECESQNHARALLGWDVGVDVPANYYISHAAFKAHVMENHVSMERVVQACTCERDSGLARGDLHRYVCLPSCNCGAIFDSVEEKVEHCMKTINPHTDKPGCFYDSTCKIFFGTSQDLYDHLQLKCRDCPRCHVSYEDLKQTLGQTRSAHTCYQCSYCNYDKLSTQGMLLCPINCLKRYFYVGHPDGEPLPSMP